MSNQLFKTKSFSAEYNQNLFCVELLSKEVNSINSIYSLQYYQNNYIAFKMERKKLYKELLDKALSFSTGPLLDIGSGSGLFLKEVAVAGIECAGIDPSEDACQIAKEQTTSEIFQGDPLSFPVDWKKGHYGIVTILDVLAHTDFPDKLLQWCHEQMRNDGIIVLKTPNHPLPFYQYIWKKYQNNPAMLQELAHFPNQKFGWGMDGIGALLKKCGFKIVLQEPYHEFQNPEIFALGDLLHPRRMLYKSRLRDSVRFLKYKSILMIAKKT